MQSLYTSGMLKAEIFNKAAECYNIEEMENLIVTKLLILIHLTAVNLQTNKNVNG